MKHLIVLPMLLLLNALPNPAINGLNPVQDSIGGLRRSFSSNDLKIPGLPKPSNHSKTLAKHYGLLRSLSSNDLPIHQPPSASSNPMQFLPSYIKLQILEYLSAIPFGLDESVEIASLYGLPADKAIQWAYQYHDPSKDDYSILLKWLEMKPSEAKYRIKDKMLMNPTLKKLLDWNGEAGLYPCRANFIRAVDEESLDMVKYFIARGVKPNRFDLYIAIEKGYLDIVKYLVDKGVKPFTIDLFIAIEHGTLDIVKILVEECQVIPNSNNLNCAIRLDKRDIVKYFINEGKVIPSGNNLGFAIRYDKLDIVKYLVEGWKVRPTQYSVYWAIRVGNLDIVQILINEGKITPTVNHLESAIHLDKLEIMEFLLGKGLTLVQETFNFAVKCGYLDIIDYFIVQEGFIPDQVTLKVAIKSRKLDVIKYLVEKRGLFPDFHNFNQVFIQGNSQLRKYFQYLADHEDEFENAYISYYGSPAA